MSNLLSIVDKIPKEPTWDPTKLLKELLEKIEKKEIDPQNMMIFFTTKGKDELLHPETWYANMTYAERIAYCQLETQRAIENWRNPSD